jgi:CheY-like chemotaxis protein
VKPSIRAIREPWAAWNDLRRPVWLFDPVALRGLYANDAALALWGAASLEELLARDFSILSPAVRTRTQRLAWATAGGEEVSERWTFYPNGQPVTVQAVISTYSLPDSTSAALLFEAAPVDAEAEERRALEALRHTSTAISLFDQEGRPLFANPAAFAAYGRSDLPLASRFVEPERAAQLLSLAMSGETATDICQVTTESGVRWHHLDARSGLDPVTGSATLLLNEHDITDTVEAQTARALAERKTAESEARQSFLTEMSHELRTPLNAVIGFADLLSRAQLAEEHVEQAHSILEGARRLATVVNEMIRIADGTTAPPVSVTVPTTPRSPSAAEERATRVLYVDDNAANRRLVVTVLGSQGFVCETAADGAEGVEAAKTGDWDVILMDIQMPVMDGVAATRAIRALGDYRAGCPIVAVTANTLAAQLDSYAAAGMNDWIEKPVNINILLDKTTGWAACGWRESVAEPAAKAAI